MTESHVIGVDFGTLSGRAVVVRVSDGAELGGAVHEYPHAVLEVALPTGEPLPPDWALQVPSDYVEVLKTAVPKAVAASGVAADDIVASPRTSPPAPCCRRLLTGPRCASCRSSLIGHTRT